MRASRTLCKLATEAIAAASWLLGVAILMESDPAWAQITKVNTVMQNVQTVLTAFARRR
jgi:type IV secretion system protein VirB2